MEYKKLPSLLELAAITPIVQPQQPQQPQQTKRPPSYSDSFYIVKQPTSRSHFEFLDLATAPQEEPQPPSHLPTRPIPPSHIPEIAIGFLFHITLISIFESLFFYYFISKSEDKGILTTVNNLLDGVTATCPWPANQTVLLRDVFQLLVNQTALQAAAATATETRTAYNDRIFLQSWMYVVALVSATVLTLVTTAWRKVLSRTSMRRIVLENVGLVALLGLYEFAFFKTIIYRYDSISVLEIEEFAVNRLQTQCGL